MAFTVNAEADVTFDDLARGPGAAAPMTQTAADDADDAAAEGPHEQYVPDHDASSDCSCNGDGSSDGSCFLGT